MNGSDPQISFVVTSRNDNHGGSLLRRMQVFVTALLAQCDRHELPAELIIVEWNPPSDRPDLQAALKWPDRPGYCRVRIIRVPESIHRRLEHSDVLPLFQMIAKNVGLRRARGKFLLATNIDIIFSDELFQLFASGHFEQGKMYRIDRHDVMSDVPLEASVSEQLEYCRTHQIRVNTREGSFSVGNDGTRRPEKVDIADAEGPIAFGSGWYAVEREASGKPFRWVGEDAEIILTTNASSSAVLEMEVEPGSGVRYRPFKMLVLDEAQRTAAVGMVQGRQVVRVGLRLRPESVNLFTIKTEGGGCPSPGDTRTLNFRVLSCSLGPEPRAQEMALDPGNLNFERSGTPLLWRLLHAAKLVGMWLTKDIRSHLLKRPIDEQLHDVVESAPRITLGSGWYDRETDDRGRVFRWVNNDAELHVEGRGDGLPLYIDMQVGPGAHDKSTLRLQVLNGDGMVLATGVLRRRKLVRLRLPPQGEGSDNFILRVHGGGRVIPQDIRVLNFRVFRCGWKSRFSLPFTTLKLRALHDAITASRVREVAEFQDGVPEVSPSDRSENHSPAGERNSRPDHLHTNACGDFTLMSKEDWFKFRGYPELEMFSMNIDSVLCFAAHYGGTSEVMLEEPCRIYHIEHSTGSGWTPEGQEKLYDRLRAKNLPYVSFAQVMGWANRMRREDRAIIFNGERWGLTDESIEETEVQVLR